MRQSTVNRKTAETDISLYLKLDGTGDSEISTGCGFLNHMLTLFSKHGRFDLKVSCVGDVDVDYHHTVEDIGICLGKAFCEGVGDKRGIKRYGNFLLPMDEALILTAVDFSGRGAFFEECEVPTEKVGDFDTELFFEFWTAFCRESGVNMHIRKLAGKNSHHIIEGAFKSAARSLREAVSIDKDFAEEIPSTKGILE